MLPGICSGNIISPNELNGIQFTVLGTPVPKGSTRAFVPKGWTRAIITSASPKTKSYAQESSSCAITAMSGRPLMEGAVEVIADYYFDRPKSQKKAIYKTTAPDGDKLLRNSLDSMTGIVFKDDAQVVSATVRKHYGSPARAEIQVREL